MKVLKKAGRTAKKLLVSVLVSLTLVSSVSGSYQQGAVAMASYVAPVTEGLKYLLMLLLAEAGVAVGSEGFDALCENYTAEDWISIVTSGMSVAEREAYEESYYMELQALQGVTTGEKINLKDYKHLLDSLRSYASHCVTVGSVKGDSVTYTDNNMSGLSIANKYLGGAACSDSFACETFANAGNFCLVYESAEGYGIQFNGVKNHCYQIVTMFASNLEDYVLYRYPVNSSYYALRLVSKDTFTGSGLGTFWTETVWAYPSTGLLQYYSGGELKNVGYSSYLYMLEEGQTVNGQNLVAFHCNYPIYDQATAEIARKFIDTPFYSYLENALVLPDDITIGTLDGITAVDDAIAQNPDATDDELAKAVTDALTQQIAQDQELKDAVDDNTDAIVAGNTWLEKIFNFLTSILQSILTALGSLNLLSTISDSLKKVLTFPKDIATEIGKVISFDNIISAVQALPQAIGDAIDIPIDFTSVVSAIQALPEAISDVITFPLPDLGVLDDILEGILAIPGALDIPVPDLGVLDDILEGLLEIPDVLADVLEGILDIPGDIADVIGRVFVLDLSLVQVAAGELVDTVELKFPFIPLFTDMLDLSFPDTYDYPVFKIQTPSAIKQFWKEDYIILFDGKNYAKHFLMVRTLLSCIFWLRFIYSVLNRFKVQLHIG